MSHRYFAAPLLALLSSAGLVACGSASGGSQTQPPDTPPQTPVAGVTNVPSGPSATPSANAAGPASDPGPSDFVAVASLPYDVRLFALDGMVVTIATQPLEREKPAGLRFEIPVGMIEGDRHTDKPSMAMAGVWAIPVAMSGSWPAGVDMLVTGTTGRTSIAEHWTLQTDGAWRTKGSRDAAFYAGMAQVGASTLALETHAMFPSFKPHIKTLRGPAVPRTVTGLDAACEKGLAASDMPRIWWPKGRLMPQAFGGMRDGTLLAVGPSACNDELLVETWASGSVTSTITKLPPTPNQTMRDAVIVVVPGAGEKNGYVIFGDILAFDGGSLKPLPALPTGVTAAAVGKDGVLWAITAERRSFDQAKRESTVVAAPELQRFDGKEWRKVVLPVEPISVVADGEGTIWVSGGKTLFRTPKKAGEKSTVAAPTKTRAASGGGADGGSKKFFRSPRQPGPLCPSNLVVLYGFTKVTPDDYDFPLTRKALKGHTEYDKARFVVAKDGGQKFFSAIVQDAQAGRNLVSLIEKEVKGSKPQLVCAEPEILRELKLDLKSGEVVK